MLTGNRVLDKQGERFLISVECDYCYKSENVEIDLSEINSKQSVARYSSSLPWWRNKVKGWMPLPEPI